MTKDVQLNPFILLLIGDAGTGKTNILSRFTKNEFNTMYKPTSGVACEHHTIIMDTQTIEMDILDIGGQKKNHFLVNSLVKDANGILLVYDISNAASFENVTYWFDIVTRFGNPKAIVKLIGNKNDLDRAIPIESVEQFVADKGVSLIETSALDPNSNVEMAFQWIIQQIGTENSFSTCGFISNHMIKNHQPRNVSCNDTQPQPFQVVLIDLKLAAQCQIRCVEIPLDDPDLKYVAISYRWGELHETVFDTKLGYTTVITSFILRDFYLLCETMLCETDLKEMDYVWVDAICVDQTNHDKRKATIHQMSNIYEKAKYILAVPDLHIEHLKNTLKSNRVIVNQSQIYQLYLYHLIHGNTDQLALMDEKYLDKCGAPDNPALRQLLNICTNHFVDGFMKYRKHSYTYDEDTILDHISINTSIEEDKRSIWERMKMGLRGDKQVFEGLHQCHQVNCPLYACHADLPIEAKKVRHPNNEKWQQLIRKRSDAIRYSMEFMADLIKDWSTRVWVISEYNIAKKKNNLKFWFIQLGPFEEEITFFKFDFMDSIFYTTIQNELKSLKSNFADYKYNNPVYLTFHQTISTQLNQQSFLEMMLKSKASKNEDRFHAIFPLTEYKNTILDKSEVDKWKIGTLTSVKIKLFQLMNTKHKLNLLFLSGNFFATFVWGLLPTFATSSINWNAPTEQVLFKDMSQCNFDLDSCDTITFCHSDLPYLNLKPKEYYIVDNYDNPGHYVNPDIWNSLPFEDSYDSNDMVCIFTRTNRLEGNLRWNLDCILLQGSFKNNIWVIISPSVGDVDYILHTIQDYNTGFNIY